MADHDPYADYTGEKSGALRRLADWTRTLGKNVRQFTFGFGGLWSETIGTTVSLIPGLSFVKSVGAAGLTAVGNILRVTDDLLKGNFKAAFTDAAAGTVETAIEGAGALLSGFADATWVPKALWVLNIPTVFGTGKYISTHAHEAAYEAIENIVGRDKTPSEILAEKMPGMQMGGLRSNQAALAMSPIMSPMQTMAQPAPGMRPDYWQAKRAEELGMSTEQLAASRGGMAEMQDARSAREAAVMNEQAMA